MKKQNELNPSENSFENEVFEALRRFDFHPPMSEKELEQYIESIGNTKIELPDSLMDADDIFNSVRNSEILFDENDNITGMAARGGSEDELPEEVIKKMKNAIKNQKWVKNNVDNDRHR